MIIITYSMELVDIIIRARELYSHLNIMTEPYWQRYLQEVSSDLEHTQDRFWKKVRDDLNRKREPKHYLELYSMCKTDNPYIRYPHSHLDR